jgi:ATP-dependent RNA helicase DHX29
MLPPQLSYEFQSHSTKVSMDRIAAPTPEQSEGYLCTVMLFILSQVTQDDKVYLRLQTVWRSLWKELLDGKQAEVDRMDKNALIAIQALIAEERGAESNGSTDDPSTMEKVGRRHIEGQEPLQTGKTQKEPQLLKSLWETKTSTVRYKKMLLSRQELPIWDYRERIVATIVAHQVTVLCAETGAGKSTQVPSLLLQNQLTSGMDSKILITQPRRISAISLARRVSEELGENKGEIGTRQSLVGYAIRLESRVSSATRITYVTTGVLVRMLESSSNLEEIDFLVLDEVHERTLDLDLLFIALRRLLQRRQTLKIVLMSATVDARKFSEYFGNAPILNIPGRTFPVEIKYLEDAIELTRSQNSHMRGPHVVETYDDDDVERNASERTRSLTVGLEYYSTSTRKDLATYDEYRIDYSLIANLAMTISVDKNLTMYSQAILIFMPGIAEIRRLHQTITSLPTFCGGWVIHLLHSSFSNEDLERAFEWPPGGHRKIVISTNIAETGITIPDVTAVIDTCREKVMRFDERRQISKLTESFISRSSARQRRGRAARVQEGICFHLVTRYRHDNLLLEHHVPEMLRMSLQDPILRVKIWNLGDIEQTLHEAFDPPSSKNIRRAIELLKDVKALTANESLTPLGRQLAKLPLDIWLGKLVLHGLNFGCLEAATLIASFLSGKSPFTTADGSDSRATAARLAFSKGNSDLLLMYNAYCAWKRASIAGSTLEFCRKNYLNQYTLSQIEDQKVQLLVTLSDTGVLHLDETEKDSLRRCRLGGKRREFFQVPERYNINSNNDFAANSVIAMALYPKLLLREAHGWRNVANNQQVNIAPTSVNKPASSPATWLSFYQTMQTKSRNPTVYETSLVPEAVIAILLGDADVRMYAGVILVDGGRVRFSIRDWKTMIALKAIRTGLQEAISNTYRNTDQSLQLASDRKWLDVWQAIVISRRALDG